MAQRYDAIVVGGGHNGLVAAALDVNPLICGPGGAVAVDALAVPAATPSNSPASHQPHTAP